jgi:8-oxo-dGTP diphosphatase
MKSKGNPGKWEPPGGKTNEREKFDDALLREVNEETGLSISLQHVTGATESDLPKLKVIHLILEGKVESGQIHLSDEHDAYVWVHPKEFPTIELADWFRTSAKTYTERKEAKTTDVHQGTAGR